MLPPSAPVRGHSRVAHADDAPKRSATRRPNPLEFPGGMGLRSQFAWRGIEAKMASVSIIEIYFIRPCGLLVSRSVGVSAEAVQEGFSSPDAKVPDGSKGLKGLRNLN